MRRTFVAQSRFIGISLAAAIVVAGCSTESGTGKPGGPGRENRVTGPAISSMALGINHAVYILADRSVRAFGNGFLLGADITMSGNQEIYVGASPATTWKNAGGQSFVKVPGGRLDEVSVGDAYSLGRVGNTLYSWGTNDASDNYRNPEDPSPPAPAPPGPNRILGLLGSSSSLFLRGAFQGGVASGPSEAFATASAVPLGSAVSAISAGAFHACAIVNGGVKCWGSNRRGQLGYQTTSRVGCDLTTPTNIVNSPRGEGVSCALLSTAQFVPLLTMSSNMISATKVAAGFETTCASFASEVACWGDDSGAILGSPSLTSTLAGIKYRVFNNFPAGVSVSKLALGASHAMALLSNGDVYVWGVFHGDGLAPYYVPQKLAFDEPVIDIATTNLDLLPHSCAVLASGKVQCWGATGSPGDGSIGAKLGAPRNSIALFFSERVTVNLGSEFGQAQRVFAGRSETCATSQYGTKCWGVQPAGQFGAGHATVIGDVEGEVATSPFIGNN